MKSKPALRALSLAALGCLGSASAFAVEGGTSYGGLSIGQSRANIDQTQIATGLLGAGLSQTGIVRDERGTAYKLFGGYQLNRNLAVEAGLFDLGKFGFTSTTAPAGTLSGQFKVRGLNLDLVGTLPLTERFSVIGRVGAQYANTRDSFSGTGAVSVLNPNRSERELNAKFGVGLQYEFSPSFLVRAEAERYRINDAAGGHGNVNVASLSLVFPFGAAPRQAPRAMLAPAYVAPAPAPVAVIVAPVERVVAAPAAVVPVPVAPERRRVSFSADSLFRFDQSSVQPDGKAALDQFARELQGTRFDVVTVEGHTDRLGSTAYNQRLSVERAEAVKAYLVATDGIDAAKISAVGKGESEPVTRQDECKGSQRNAKLIACLQPDRRVEVEVNGTR